MPSPQLEIRLILMIFLNENDADMTEIIYFPLFGKKAFSHGPFFAFFVTFQNWQVALVTFVFKIDKIRTCSTFFQKYFALMAVFFSNFHTKTAFSHALT